MKRISIRILALALLCQSCATGQMSSREAEGVLTGASIGGTLGSAIGGLIGDSQDGWHGGYRGSAIGTILGTVAGAAIGHAATRTTPPAQATPQPEVRPAEVRPFSPAIDQLRIYNVQFVNQRLDQTLHSSEDAKIIFEVLNEGRETAFHVVPMIQEMNGLKRLYVSPPVMVEQITPGGGIKYTASVHTGKRLKSGEAVFRLSVTDEWGQEYDWQEFVIPTFR